jgi:hypothetical protein
VYRVVDCKPHYKHALPECLKAYQSHIFDDVASFEKYRKLFAMFKKYRALLLPGKLSDVEFRVIDTVHTLDWFLEAQNNVIDLNPCYERFECCGDLGEPSNPWDNDESDDPDDNLVLAQLAMPLVPAVPVAKRKGEAYEAFMSEYTSVCQTVDKVDDDVREMFGQHFANLRQELLQRLGQKRKNNDVSSTTDGIASCTLALTKKTRLDCHRGQEKERDNRLLKNG